jgi:hypothetical protein
MEFCLPPAASRGLTGSASDRAASAGDDTGEDARTDEAAPTGAPVLCLFDGVPAANHPLLAGRVTIFDPERDDGSR